MPIVNVITPAGPGTEQFLPEAAESIWQLHPVPGWEINWLVVADGPDGEENEARAQLATTLGAARVWANHTRYWGGAARNRALAHTTGEWTTTLDADDRFLPDALVLWAESATAAPPNTWLAFPMLDWFPDEGNRIAGGPDPFPPGLVPAGKWLDYFEQHWSHPIASATVMWQTDMLLTCGGWGASPIAQDAMPDLCISTRWPGWWHPEPTYLCRRHPGQITHKYPNRPLAEPAQDALLLAVRQASLWRVGNESPRR